MKVHNINSTNVRSKTWFAAKSIFLSSFFSLPQKSSWHVRRLRALVSRRHTIYKKSTIFLRWRILFQNIIFCTFLPLLLQNYPWLKYLVEKCSQIWKRGQNWFYFQTRRWTHKSNKSSKLFSWLGGGFQNLWWWT